MKRGVIAIVSALVLTMNASAIKSPQTDNNVVLYYTLNEEDISFNLLNDLSRYKNNGVIYGSPYQNSDAIEFDGVDDYVKTNDSYSLNIFDNDFSISMWIFPFNITNNVLPRLIEKRSEYLAIMGNPNNLRFGRLAFEAQAAGGTNTVEFWSREKVKLGEWQHVVFVYQSGEGQWYFNGRKVLTDKLEIGGAWQGDIQDTFGHDVYLARRRADLQRNFNGMTDEVILYNKKLNSREVRDLYNFNY